MTALATDIPLAARIVAALSDNLEPEPLRLPLPPLYDAQRQIKAEARRFNVLDIGRRAGKTYLGTHLALECAGQGHPVGWFAPSYKYLLEVWQFLSSTLQDYATKINATERRIELKNGGLIECWTLDGTDDPGRSRKYKLAIIDEAAIASNLKAAWEEAIRATLTDLIGGAWFLSTPKGLNFFYDLFQRGQDSDAYPEWKSWQMPSSVNPFLPSSEIEAAERDLPAATFSQEYGAKFLQNEGAVFRNVDACLRSRPTTPAEHLRHVIVSGVDWGREHDFTAQSIVCVTCAREVRLDRFNQIGWAFQRSRILSNCEAWNVRHAIIETNSIGAPNLEALQQSADEGLILQGFLTTPKSKGPLILGLALAFERETLHWLGNDVARHELIAYESNVTKTGYTQYSAPDGGWDDTVIARALARHAFAMYWPIDLPAGQKRELQIPEGLREWNIEKLTGDERDLAELHRGYRLKKVDQEARQSSTWSNEIIDSGDNPWANIE